MFKRRSTKSESISIKNASDHLTRIEILQYTTCGLGQLGQYQPKPISRLTILKSKIFKAPGRGYNVKTL